MQQLCEIVVLCAYFAAGSLTEHIATGNRKLYEAVQKVKESLQQNQRSLPSRDLKVHQNLANTLRHFIADHTYISVVIAKANADFCASLTFGSEVIHVPNNAYMLCRLVLTSNSGTSFEYLHLNYSILFTEAILVIIPLVIIARGHSIIHQCKRKLPTVQWLLLVQQRRNLIVGSDVQKNGLNQHLLSLQNMLFYERLTSGPKVGISIGPIEVITDAVLLQLITIYIVYVLSIIKMFY